MGLESRVRLAVITDLAHNLRGLIERRLSAKVLVAIATGVGAGLLLDPARGYVSPRWSATLGDWLALPGQVFLTLVQMIVVPLLLASIVGGLFSARSTRLLRRMGVGLTAYFSATAMVGLFLGVALAWAIDPGSYVPDDLAAMMQHWRPDALPDDVARVRGVHDVVGFVLPRNLLGAMVEMRMVHVVATGVILGAALLGMPRKEARPLIDLLDSLRRVCIAVLSFAMKLVPFAVFGLMTRMSAVIGLRGLVAMGVYIATVLAGLALLLLMYAGLVAVVGKRSPIAFLRTIRELQLLAFSTSSSAAVMPLSEQTAHERLGVRPEVAGVTVPLGATFNMDATAVYQAIAAVFVVGAAGMDLGPQEIALVVVGAVLGSVGSPSTPGAAMLVLSMALVGIGVPVSLIMLVIAVDRVLDMTRTAVNVAGDLTACVLMERWVARGPALLVAEEEPEAPEPASES